MKAKYILRQIGTRKTFSLLKLVSLVIGFTVLAVLSSLVREELSYDKFWDNPGTLYRVAMEQYMDGELAFRSAKAYRGLSAILQEEFPEVEENTRLGQDIITVFVGEQQIQDVAMFWADTNVFQVLPRKILARESQNIFPDIHSMAISDKLAMKLYGTIDCLGEELKLNEGWIFYISTVFEHIPERSHLEFDVLAQRASVIYYLRNFDNSTGMMVDTDDFSYADPGPYHPASWNMRLANSYIRIHPEADVAQLRIKARELMREVELPERLGETVIVPVLQKVEDIHLKSDLPSDASNNSSWFYVYMLILMALVVLVVSWINFINLFSVVFHEDQRGTAIRVINGADRSLIRWEIFAKGLLISLSAMLVSILLLFLYQHLSPGYRVSWPELAILALAAILSALLASFVPLLSFQTAQTISYLKGNAKGVKGTAIFRQIAVGLQFAASVILIASAVLMFSQMRYVQREELSFNGGGVVYSFSPMTMNMRPDIPEKLAMFRDELERLPGLESFSVSSSIPGKPYLYPSIIFRHMVGEKEKEVVLERLQVDPWYFELYQIGVVQGQVFGKNLSYNSDEVVLNRLAAEILGYSEPGQAVGEVLRRGEQDYRIIGVVEDYHHRSLKEPLAPIVFFKSLNWWNGVGFYSFSLGSDHQETLAHIGKIWEEVYPGELFIAHSLIDTYNEQYREEKAFSSSFLWASLLAMVVSCLGLAGLSRYQVQKRTREIGIRKTYGSSIRALMVQLHRETARLVLLASLTGVPISWWIMRRWLENFAFRTDPSWWMFLLSAFLTYAIATIVTFHQIMKAASQNPVEALRYE